jgi:formylglycine-generating enzyme required for sulfatase activity
MCAGSVAGSRAVGLRIPGALRNEWRPSRPQQFFSSLRKAPFEWDGIERGLLVTKARVLLFFAAAAAGALIAFVAFCRGAQKVLGQLSSATTSHAPGAAFRDCLECPEMVVIPAGHFTMGSSDAEKMWAAAQGGSQGAVSDEAPQHEVTVPSFVLGKYDVTRGEYAAFARETGYPAGDGCGRGRSIFKWAKDPKLTWENPGHAQTDRDPVVCVSWQDARASTRSRDDRAPIRVAHQHHPARLPT